MGKKNNNRKNYFSAKRNKTISGIRRLFVKRKYRDELFRRLFNKPKELLSLYNAINRTDYQDESALEVYTLENALYIGYKNDVSFIICGILNLYEHQSSLNPNMPLRGLIYFSRQYEAYIAQHKYNIYNSGLIKLPYPQYIVLYNGTRQLKDDVDYMELRLSDSFEKPAAGMDSPALECIAKVYNINYGRNKELMMRCRKLEEYSIFTGKITERLTQGRTLKEAVNLAINECIEEGILEDFLRKHRAEVVGMLFEQFDMKEQLKLERRDGYNEGKEEGEERLSHLIQLLISESRMEDIAKAANDKAYRNKLFDEFNL